MRGKEKFLKFSLFLGDVILMYFALFLALLIRNKNLFKQTDNFIYSFSILYLFWLFVMFILDFYEIHFFKNITDFFLNLIIFSILAVLFGITYFYLKPQPNITPKTILVLDVLIFAILFSVWRYLVSRILEIKKFKERIIIVGFRKELKEILPQINKSAYEIISIFYPPFLKRQEKRHLLFPKINIVSDIDDLNKIIAENRINSIVFAIDFYLNKNLIKNIFLNIPLTLNYITFNDFYEQIAKKVSLKYLDEVWFLEEISKSEDKLGQISKRLFDVVFSVLGLLLFIILFPIVALLIKVDSKESVFYKQKRVGKNKKIFTLYKFRTMVESPIQDKVVWREKKKGNITRPGKMLRKLHIDELPQLISILKGDLSFVGPRPEWVELAKIFEKEIPFYSQRYLVKPGFTGWAQINFPASTSIQEAKEKFEYDLYYIKNRSFILDIGIILKTIKIILK